MFSAWKQEHTFFRYQTLDSFLVVEEPRDNHTSAADNTHPCGTRDASVIRGLLVASLPATM